MKTKRAVQKIGKLPTSDLRAKISRMSITHYGMTAMKLYGDEVNLDRATPDLIDGLKPVHRRIAWTASQLPKAEFVKSARVVGDCFAAGTRVSIIGGKSLPIEQLVIGDEVITDTGSEVVINTFVLHKRELYEINTSTGLIQATPDQIFYCIDASGSEVERTPLTLKTGDKIKII